LQEHGDRRRLKRQTAPLKREFKALLGRGSVGSPSGGRDSGAVPLGFGRRPPSRSLFAYLAEVAEASIRGQPAPALV